MTTVEYMTVSKDQTSTLMARDYKDPQCVAYQTVHVFDPAQITSKLHHNQMIAGAPCHTMHRLAPPAIVIRSSIALDRPAVFDARGNGDGNIAPTITGNHNSRIKIAEDGIVQTPSGRKGTGGGQHTDDT